MTLAGLHLEDPRTGLCARVVSADEERGSSFVLEYTAPVGSPKELIFPHRHESWTEHFEVLSGHARYRLGNRETELPEGAAVEMPPGVVHLHPWNAGNTELRVRQSTTLLRPDPAAVRDTIQGFAMMFWLTRQGKVNSLGLPSPLQAAVILQVLQQHGGSLPGLPVFMQRTLINLLASWGRRRGYVAFDPVAFDPAAFGASL